MQSVILEVAERLILKILFVPDFAGEHERDCPFEADSVNPTWWQNLFVANSFNSRKLVLLHAARSVSSTRVKHIVPFWLSRLPIHGKTSSHSMHSAPSRVGGWALCLKVLRAMSAEDKVCHSIRASARLSNTQKPSGLRGKGEQRREIAQFLHRKYGFPSMGELPSQKMPKTEKKDKGRYDIFPGGPGKEQKIRIAL